MKTIKLISSGIISLLTTILFFSLPVCGQPAGFQPRDKNEIEAWGLYNGYKSRIEQIESLKKIILINRKDLWMMDKSDRKVLDANLEQLGKLQKQQEEASATWQNKFYWRYGDLSWSDKQKNGVVNDPLRGDMDHIEFALVYFPFDYKPGNLSTKSDNPASVPNTLTLETPGYWGHLNYTINGARLDPPSGSDRGKVGGRQYTGELTGDKLLISGTGISENPSSGAGSLDYYELTATVSVGNKTESYSYIAPKGEKLSKPYSLSVPVQPGMSGSFKITLIEQNAYYGPHGWVVSGSLSARKATAVPAKSTNQSKAETGVSRDGKSWSPVNTGTMLKAGDQVKSGSNSTTSLKMADIIKILLNKNSWFSVINESKSSPSIKLNDGNVKISLPTMPAGSNLKIDMSQAIATVKGTNFELWENGQKSTIRVSEGVVEFRNKYTDETRNVYPGQTVHATTKGLSDIKEIQSTDIKENNVTTGQEIIVFKLESLAGVYENPVNKTVFTLAKPTLVTKIMTYHWNGGQGAEAGTMSLRNVNTGKVLGTWNAIGTKNLVAMNTTPYYYWVTNPNIMLPAGKYEVIDSDRSTWSTNGEMGNMGCAWVWGKQ